MCPWENDAGLLKSPLSTRRQHQTKGSCPDTVWGSSIGKTHQANAFKSPSPVCSHTEMKGWGGEECLGRDRWAICNYYHCRWTSLLMDTLFFSCVPTSFYHLAALCFPSLMLSVNLLAVFWPLLPPLLSPCHSPSDSRSLSVSLSLSRCEALMESLLASLRWTNTRHLQLQLFPSVSGSLSTPLCYFLTSLWCLLL